MFHVDLAEASKLCICFLLTAKVTSSPSNCVHTANNVFPNPSHQPEFFIVEHHVSHGRSFSMFLGPSLVEKFVRWT